MVNTSLNWVSIVGIVLMLGGALLFSLRTYKPALSRDTDVFFAAVGLLCGGILFFQGWRLDPILQFSQFLLATTTVFFVYESVRLRGVTAEQARRSEFVDDPEGDGPRPPIGSGLDEWDSLEQRPPMGRRALAAADWDRVPSRRPVRRATAVEEQPEWRDDYPPPLPPRQVPARQDWDNGAPPATGGRRPIRRSGDPQRPETTSNRGRGTPRRRAQLEPPAGERPSPRFQPREPRPAPPPQRSSARTRRVEDRAPLVGRRQRRAAVQPEPFDQDPDLKLARSVPRAPLPPQGNPISRSPRATDSTAALREPQPKNENEQDNSSRFDD